MQNAIVARQLRKQFACKTGTIEAVRCVDLSVAAGEVFGFLGPNGAGKTTTLRMLTTLLPIDGGVAEVSGLDVARHPDQVRRHIGYVGQLGGADSPATGRENLLLQGQLHGANYREANRRAEELIDALDLGGFADRKVSTYSGGQRRRLEIALGIAHRPDVLFLDEPTTGLDPQNRANLWEQVRRLRDNGTTVFLTTHYLEEADALADRVAIIDHGEVIACGTPQELKQQIAGSAITITFNAGYTGVGHARELLARQPYVLETTAQDSQVQIYVADGEADLPAVIRLLDQEGMEIPSISLSKPTLDDVFLKQTGRLLRDS